MCPNSLGNYTTTVRLPSLGPRTHPIKSPVEATQWSPIHGGATSHGMQAFGGPVRGPRPENNHLGFGGQWWCTSLGDLTVFFIELARP